MPPTNSSGGEVFERTRKFHVASPASKRPGPEADAGVRARRRRRGRFGTGKGRLGSRSRRGAGARDQQPYGERQRGW